VVMHRSALRCCDSPPRRPTSRGLVGLQAARDHLRVRLVPEPQLRGSGVRYVARELTAGLHLALAFDTPDQVVFVHPRDLARWGRPEDELFALARANTEAEPALEPFEVKTPGPVAVIAFLGDSAFATSHVLFLERYLDRAAHGHLVAMPDRHALLALPLSQAGALKAVGSLVMMAQGRFAGEPGPISDQLYWRRPSGTLVPVALAVRDGGERWIAVPPELDEALGRLAR
jgi:hypothetical protein